MGIWTLSGIKPPSLYVNVNQKYSTAITKIKKLDIYDKTRMGPTSRLALILLTVFTVIQLTFFPQSLVMLEKGVSSLGRFDLVW